MIEVQNGNFRRLLPDILAAIRTSTFIAIDTEFSALYLHEDDRPSLFDTAAKRYEKLRSTALRTLPLQVGVAIFTFEPAANTYRAQTYAFYVCPKAIAGVNHNLHFQATSVHFLARHAFDFNALFHHGVPFLNQQQEVHVRNALTTGGWTPGMEDMREMIENVILSVETWHKNDEEKTLTLHMHNDPEMLYLMREVLAKKYGNKLRTEINDGGDVKCVKVEEDEFRQNDANTLIEETLNDLLGFTHVYRALVRSRKPIIGHNMLMDLLLLEHAFGDELPKNYERFKQLLHAKFPHLYDTKAISFGVARSMHKDDVWSSSMLSSLYKYFNEGVGKHLSFNSPIISHETNGDAPQFHNAGWDAYCTGYIFIRMAHYMSAKGKGGSLRDVMSVEHFANVSPWRNRLNLIRATISHLVIDGNDPKTRRPPKLVAKSHHGRFLEINNVRRALSKFGYVEVQRIDNRRALIAISNWPE